MMIVESNDINDVVVKGVNDLSVAFEGKLFQFITLYIILFSIYITYISIYLCIYMYRYMFINSFYQERC